ncbi:MAG TPA: septum formation initiator family protein [Candidatus Marinimicrobia bacterium]|jgi:cell division protein FtsB|nr:septum formation initiator family protein [Candidatus Neomarinimicrobiota bacterium]
MTRYDKMKRHNRPRAVRQQVAETQRKFVRGVLLLIGVTLLIIFIFGDHGIFQLYKLKREREQVQTHITQLRENREKLIAEKNRLENDLEYIEKLARERFRMAKPGEKVFKVIQKKEAKDLKSK